MSMNRPRLFLFLLVSVLAFGWSAQAANPAQALADQLARQIDQKLADYEKLISTQTSMQQQMIQRKAEMTRLPWPPDLTKLWDDWRNVSNEVEKTYSAIKSLQSNSLYNKIAESKRNLIASSMGTLQARWDSNRSTFNQQFPSGNSVGIPSNPQNPATPAPATPPSTGANPSQPSPTTPPPTLSPNPDTAGQVQALDKQVRAAITQVSNALAGVDKYYQALISHPQFGKTSRDKWPNDLKSLFDEYLSRFEQARQALNTAQQLRDNPLYQQLPDGLKYELDSQISFGKKLDGQYAEVKKLSATEVGTPSDNAGGINEQAIAEKVRRLKDLQYSVQKLYSALAGHAAFGKVPQDKWPDDLKKLWAEYMGLVEKYWALTNELRSTLKIPDLQEKYPKLAKLIEDALDGGQAIEKEYRDAKMKFAAGNDSQGQGDGGIATGTPVATGTPIATATIPAPPATGTVTPPATGTVTPPETRPVDPAKIQKEIASFISQYRKNLVIFRILGSMFPQFRKQFESMFQNVVDRLLKDLQKRLQGLLNPGDPKPATPPVATEPTDTNRPPAADSPDSQGTTGGDTTTGTQDGAGQTSTPESTFD